MAVKSKAKAKATPKRKPSPKKTRAAKVRGVKLAARSSAGNAAAVAVVAIPTAPGIVRAALEAAKSRSMTRGKLIKLLKPEFGDNASRKLRRAVDLIRRTSKLVYAKPAKVEPTFTLKG